MKIKRINIGKEIKNIVNEKMGNHAHFGRLIGISRSNLNAQVFNRSSIDTSLLIQISEILEFNFFNLYSDDSNKSIEKKNVAKFFVKVEMELTGDEIIQLGIKEKVKEQLK